MKIINTCLLYRYAILSILHYDDVLDPSNRGRVNQYQQWVDVLNFTGTTFPFNIGVSLRVRLSE